MATVKATNHVLQQQPSGKAQDKEIITYLTDAIALSLQCYHDINSIRCQAMKKDLHKDYAALPSAAIVPVLARHLYLGPPWGKLHPGSPTIVVVVTRSARGQARE